jgi:uncharacterized protein
MRVRIVGVIVIITFSAAWPLLGQHVPPKDSARAETVKRLFAVTKAAEFHGQLINGIVARYEQTPFMAPVIEQARAFLAKHATFAAFEDELIALHREFYSETELKELIRFYESPVGQRVSAITPMLSQRMNQVVSARMATLLPELTRELERTRPPQSF